MVHALVQKRPWEYIAETKKMYRGDTELSEPKKDKWLDQADDVESERTNKDVSSSSRSGQTGLLNLSFININSFLIFKCA